MVWNKLLKEVKLLIFALFEVHTEKMLGSLNRCLKLGLNTLAVSKFHAAVCSIEMVQSEQRCYHQRSLNVVVTSHFSICAIKMTGEATAIFVPIAIPCVWGFCLSVS